MVSFNELNVQKLSRKDIYKLSLVKNGDIGTLSKVYRLNNLECLKIYKKAKDEYDLYRLNEFTKLKYEHVVMPNRLVIINNKFKGYIMDFINGTMLCDCEKLDFSFMLKKYKEFIDNVIDETVDDGIMLYDCNACNVIYDTEKQCFKLIDCDEWAIHTYYRGNEIIQNYRMLHSTFNYLITNKYNALEYDFYDFIDYFECLRQMEEKRLGIKIKTIGDFKNR